MNTLILAAEITAVLTVVLWATAITAVALEAHPISIRLALALSGLMAVYNFGINTAIAFIR